MGGGAGRAAAGRVAAAAAGGAARGAALAARALDPDNTSILVAGGGGTALEVARRLKDMGAWVWMLQRTEAHRGEIEGMMAIVHRGDALDPACLAQAAADIDDLDAVVSCVGNAEDLSADSQGNVNLIEAAKAAGAQRFVLVSGSPESPLGEAQLAAKGEAEDALRASGVEYTIVRPAGALEDGAADGSGALTEGAGVGAGSRLRRGEAAALVCRALFSDRAAGKTVTAVAADALGGQAPFET